MKRLTLTLGVAAVSAMSFAASASAQTARVSQDSTVGGQINRCWGEIASQTAKLETTGSGGGMGWHSRATTAADINGGFANSSNLFGITFNVDGGRQGVGNVSADSLGPHHTSPGDGGNGQHAVNNGEFFANILDPVTGQLATSPSTLQCSLDVTQNVVP